MSSSSITIGVSRSNVDTLSDDSSSSSFGVATSSSVAWRGDGSAIGLGIGQSDADALAGDAHASSAGIGAGDSVALNGNANAIGMGIGQSEADSTAGDSVSSASSVGTGTGEAAALHGNATAIGVGIGQSDTDATSGGADSSSAGIGAGEAVALHGNATAVGLGIGQSDSYAQSGNTDSTSLGVGTAEAVAHQGEANATGMGMAQAGEHSPTGSAEYIAVGAGHGEATGASSFAVGAGAGQVETIGQPLHEQPGAFGSGDLSVLAGQHGGHRMEALVERFESSVEHLMEQAHEYLQHGDSEGLHFGDSLREFQSEWSFGGRGVHGEASLSFNLGESVDPSNQHELRDVSFTFNEEITLGNNKTISLSFAFAEEDDGTTGKAQIATGFGMAEGAGARSNAVADAGFAHADAGALTDYGHSFQPLEHLTFA